MTWEQQLEALQSLGRCCLKMRVPGNWYVEQPRVSIATGGMLVGKFGQGTSPEEAVEDHWRQYTTYVKDERVKVEQAGKVTGLYVRWDGYRWKEWIT